MCSGLRYRKEINIGLQYAKINREKRSHVVSTNAAAIDYCLHSNVTGINPRKLPAFPAPQFTQRIRCERTVAGENFTVLCTRPVMSSLIMFMPIFFSSRRSTRWDDPAYSLSLAFVCLGVWECANGITIQWVIAVAKPRNAAGPWQREITKRSFLIATVKRQPRSGFLVNQ